MINPVAVLNDFFEMAAREGHFVMEERQALAALVAERDKQIRLGDALRLANANLRDERDQLSVERDRMRARAKNAKGIAAAPDYDEEAIRDALWALADGALADVPAGDDA